MILEKLAVSLTSLFIVHVPLAFALKVSLSIVARKASIDGRHAHMPKIVQQMTLIYAPSDNDAKRIWTQSQLIQSSVGL